MSLKVDKIQLDIIINSDPARQKLNALYSEATGLQKEIRKWKEGTAEYIAATDKLKTVQTNIDNVKREIGITNMTLKELTSHQKELNLVMIHMDPNIPAYQLLKQEAKEVGDRIGELRGKAKGVGADLANAGGAFNKFFGGLSAKVKEWGSTIVTAFSAMAVVSFFKDSVKEALEAEKSMQKFGFAIKNIGGGNDSDIARMAKQAKDLMGIFTHEQIEEAGTKMINFGLSLHEVESIMPLMVDAAAQSGKSLEELATAIDKGKESGVFFKSALGQLGVNFKDTGDKGKNFQLIMEGLTKFTGGNSDALKTNSGRLTYLKTMWNEFKETLGEKFLGDRSSGLLGGLTNMIQYLTDNASAVMSVIVALGRLITVTAAWRIGTLAAASAETLRTTVTNLFTKATKEAMVAEEAEQAVQKRNVWGLIAAGIALAATYLIEYLTASEKVSRAQQVQTAYTESYNKSLISEQIKLKDLFEQLRATNVQSTERAELIDRINSTYGTTLKNLSDEKAFVNQLDVAYQNILISIEKKAMLNAREGALTEANKQELESRTKYQDLVDKLNEEGYQQWDGNQQKMVWTMRNTSKLSFTEFIQLASDVVEGGRVMNKELAEIDKKKKQLLLFSDDDKKLLISGNKGAGDSIDELREKWKNLTLEELEAKKAGVSEFTGKKWEKGELKLLNTLIAEKKKSFKEGERDELKYEKTWEDLQQQMKDIAKQNFSETLSEYDKEIRAVNEKYDKLIEAEKKYITDVAAIKDPKVRAGLQGNVNQAGDNVKQLEKEKSEQLNKIIVDASKNLAKDVDDINKKVARAQMSILNQQLQDIKDHYQKEITETYTALEVVKKAKLDALAASNKTETEKAEEGINIEEWYQDQKLQIDAQAAIVTAESEREQKEATLKNTQDLLKEQEDLYKKYKLLDENSEIESDRKAALTDLYHHRKEFKSEEDFLRAKANLNKQYDERELAEKEDLSKKKIEKYKSYFNTANSIANEASNFVTSLKDMELQKAGDNEEKKKAILKKYADIEMVANIAKIITGTAVGAMQAFELGPIAGAIMSGLIIIEGGVELGLAIDQRNKIKGLESGLYPDYMLATREQDGKKFRTKVSRDHRSQRINQPTTFIAGERMPEIMLDGLVTKDLEMNAPMIMNGLKQSIVRVHGVAPGFEGGYYGGLLDSARRSGPAHARVGVNSPHAGVDTDVMKEFNGLMRQMIDNGLHTKLSIYELNKYQEKYDEARKNFSS